jgi:antibiotic biosynthesis monooxygenase (ABM) superfamily enzyme
MTLVVILTVRSEAVDTFRAFEKRAAAVMAKYGGAIERTVVIAPQNGADFFKEIHFVTFPNEQAFLAYRQDGELQEVASLRAESVVDTELMIGEDGPDYGSAG